MKKWFLILLFLPCFLIGNEISEFYIGEMKSQSPDEEEKSNIERDRFEHAE